MCAGNTLCKSGSIAVFGNVVYSGLLNEPLWHLGVPLFTRLVRAAATAALAVAAARVGPDGFHRDQADALGPKACLFSAAVFKLL